MLGTTLKAISLPTPGFPSTIWTHWTAILEPLRRVFGASRAEMARQPRIPLQQHRPAPEPRRRAALRAGVGRRAARRPGGARHLLARGPAAHGGGGGHLARPTELLDAEGGGPRCIVGIVGMPREPLRSDSAQACSPSAWCGRRLPDRRHRFQRTADPQLDKRGRLRPGDGGGPQRLPVGHPQAPPPGGFHPPLAGRRRASCRVIRAMALPIRVPRHRPPPYPTPRPPPACISSQAGDRPGVREGRALVG